MYHYSKADHPQAALTDLGLEENTRRVRIRTMAEVYPIAARIQDWMQALAYPRLDVLCVRLTLLEAVANAIHHGNRDDPAKHVEVRYLVRPWEVIVEVHDEGRGFDPNAVPGPRPDDPDAKPTGWGLLLMRAYTNCLSFNPRGNQVTLYRRRSEP